MARLLIVFATVLSVAVAGCAIPTENSVRPIELDDVPDRLKPIPETTTPASIPVPGFPVEIYFYRQIGEVIDLVPVTRLAESRTPEAALRALLAAKPTEEEEEEGLKSFLGEGTAEEPIQLLNVENYATRRIAIDLTRIPSIEGELAAIPWAQMVFTATQDFGGDGPRVDRARFEEQGIQVPSLSESETVGQGRTLSRAQFLSYNPAQRPPVTIPGSTVPPDPVPTNTDPPNN